ncbi:MAG TPA: GAF domain-containing SpoIIE family protein phosphatase [Acidimicrobiales bacterium]|nr:GAF domain-containing SpoIIE family protein phosphatase [Acidimicrobiales bacterium]
MTTRADGGEAAVAGAGSIHDDPLTSWEAFLGRLLELSHTMAPHALAWVVADLAAEVGLDDLVIHLVDLDQRLLLPLATQPGTPAGEPLDIDATIAGRAFRTETIIEVEAPGDERRRRVWVPLMDGAERLGVMSLITHPLGDLSRARCHHLAAVVAELIVSKSQYGDTLPNARRRRPMELAAELRWAVLPPLSFTGPRVTIAGILEPAYEVAGDAFDYALNGDIAHVAVFDAMGHGLEASRMANLAVGAYRHSRRLGLDLAATYAAMDRAVANEFGAERFVTGVLATLHCGTGELSWVIAGHPRPLVLRGAKMIGELSTDPSLPFGLGGAVATPAVTSLEPGDRVLFFSDGVVEARSATGELFGKERLGDLLVRASADAATPPETMRRLVHAVLAHQGSTLKDDATLLLVEWRRPG